MEPKTTALVLIVFRNDYVEPGGAQHEAAKDVMASTKMFAHAQELAATAREASR
jgi:nicotinamidase-related amidase